MLSNKEKKIMDYMYSECIGKKSVLIAPDDIQNFLQPKYEINEIEIEQIINNLVLENYIDVINSDKNGKLIYCVSLRTRGEAYLREKKNKKKSIYLILGRTIILACISFAVTMILKAIFKF